MCGICGIAIYNDPGRSVDRQELLAMRDSMARRGPDGSGVWISDDQRTGLAHRRLSIIDLSDQASQPMTSDDGRYHIAYNGEIYNYRELQTALKAKGYRFRTSSDTEVLLCLYADEGKEMVHRLRGMFAFAIWDEKHKTMLLARDHFGIKPLYYSDDGTTIRFASQVKALIKGQRVDTSPQPARQVGFFLLGYVPEPFTLYKGIQQLPAGTTLLLNENGRQDIQTFFSVSNELARAADQPTKEISRPEMQRQLAAALKDSVEYHLVADVPVGVFLSSGLDSTVLTALASGFKPGSLHTNALCFNLQFPGVSAAEPLIKSVLA